MTFSWSFLFSHILLKGISFVKQFFEFFFLLRAKRASICGTERVRLSREAANAEVLQSKVELSQAFTAWKPYIPILTGIKSRRRFFMYYFLCMWYHYTSYVLFYCGDIVDKRGGDPLAPPLTFVENSGKILYKLANCWQIFEYKKLELFIPKFDCSW